MSNPFAGKGRIRRSSERQTSFESLVLYLRQEGGMSTRRESQLRKAWADLDASERAYLLAQPRSEWAEVVRGGKVREFLRGEDG